MYIETRMSRLIYFNMVFIFCDGTTMIRCLVVKVFKSVKVVFYFPSILFEWNTLTFTERDIPSLNVTVGEMKKEKGERKVLL